MAWRLQEEMDLADAKQEREDLEAARRLQFEEADSKRLEDDANFAKELYLSDQKSDTPPNSNGDAGAGGSSYCAGCGKSMHLVRNSLTALGKSFCNNNSCFSCALCASHINDASFQVFEGSPVHASCFREVVVPSCVVCDCKVPTNSQGHYSYNKHPFFQSWKYCATHEEARRCTSCNRVEPRKAPFAKLGDSRVLCDSCCRTTILDSDELKPIWSSVLTFLHKLDLVVWPEMSNIPILSVDFNTLNEKNSRGGSAHMGQGGPITRGLCLTETEGEGLMMPQLSFDPRQNGFSMQHRHFSFGQSTAHVTAILVLSGLPKLLTGSILAHEAIHAWLKLHPGYLTLINRTGGEGFNRQSEEGVCQLVAHLYLASQERTLSHTTPYDASSSSSSSSTPSSGDLTESQLNQFFKFSIETEKSPVYGEGYRKAAKLYEQIGLEPILQLMVENGALPE
ncbi:hypothetical protein TL16_g11356 [Triparma laevis f. inornata]|uniref:LIM zinc-binding domain-containing protein n=2 Tax=Triparma laevis TaxID=1534972 RepID=A0A9W7C7C7_9STRA|nr:hypothetical protein TL16_g11356 [Triparma laevis f. inornata]GMI01011.1 hypothetical protein TrLO_g5999 [Triparma laevis f. longispina]